MTKSKINEYIKWMEKHYDEKTGEYKKPRSTIVRNGKYISKLEEMTEEEIEEYKLAIWWLTNSTEKIIYQRYINMREEQIPEEYREFIKKMKELFSKNNTRIYKYLEWMEKHYDKETGKYKKPRSSIYINGNIAKIEEMTEEEKEEYRLATWWTSNSVERKIIKIYEESKIDEIPKEYRNFVERFRKLNKKPECNIKKHKFNYMDYLNWIKDHKVNQKCKLPRINILRDGRVIKYDEMTEEEQKEHDLAIGFKYSEEKEILDKYLYISNDEFINLSEKEKQVIILYSQTGIKNKYNIVEIMNLQIERNAKDNEKARQELNKIKQEIEEER